MDDHENIGIFWHTVLSMQYIGRRSRRLLVLLMNTHDDNEW